jgi:uncharacterized protein (TIGR00369 family)
MQAGAGDDPYEEISLVGFNRHIGPIFLLAPEDDGTQRFVFTAREIHMNAAGTVHGGMLMSFMDVAMSKTARGASATSRLSTIALSCDFVSPARLGERIEARVHIRRRARSVVFLSGELVAEERTLLIGTGLWKVVPSA